jgi:ribosomal protein S18 acetylase RimI-like enzyme
MEGSAVIRVAAARGGGDSIELVFEYMAATQAETGQPVPAGIGDLPGVLQRECRDLQSVYRPPGVFLIAYQDDFPAGCVGLAPAAPARTAEVKRLYVRPAHRRLGIARTLMSHVHQHAARSGLIGLVLDVLPTRTEAIGFYRGLGYRDYGSVVTGSPAGLICMERAAAAATG